MILILPLCPTCGQPAMGIVESVLGVAQLDCAEGADFDYAGRTDMEWDTQKPVLDEDHQATLLCEQKHQWQSLVTPDAKEME